MLLATVPDVVAPRVHYRQSGPEPSSILATPPAEVIVHFSGELAPESTIRVVSTVSILPSGEWSYSGGENVVTESGLDPNDPSHQSLRAVLRPGLPNGLYRVDWSTVAARGKTERSGCYYFGVGMSVPASVTRDLGGLLRERDIYPYYEDVSPQAIAVTGVLLTALAILLPWLRPYKWDYIP
jgi:methionine-rich copper-binding protein CopC